MVEQWELAVRNQRGLLGMVLAHALGPRGKVESQYRRLQRFLANARVEAAAWQTTWARMVVTGLKTDRLKLSVDATDLSDHLGVRGLRQHVLGAVFKKAGWLPAHITVARAARFAQLWCLVGSDRVSPQACPGHRPFPRPFPSPLPLCRAVNHCVEKDGG